MTSSLAFLETVTPLRRTLQRLGNRFQKGLSREQAVAKLEKDNVIPTGAEKTAYLQNVWDNKHTHFFKHFLKWYKKKDVLSTLEAMQKMIEGYHNKGIDMLKIGCTLPHLGNTRSQKSTDLKLYPSTATDKDLLEKLRKDTVGGRS